MPLFQKPIFTGFMPNLQTKDVALALSFFLPWKWGSMQTGNSVAQAETWLQNYYKVSSATCFDSGRSALYFALQALDIQPGDEVLVQAYTCAVVSNAIIWSGATPVYVDIQSDFTLDPKDVEKKITQRTKVIIIQHTFGIPADIDALQKIAKNNNLKVIEDCAHVIGGTYHGQMLGTFGDIGMLSFGTEKPVSCGRGGALLTNNATLAKKISALQKNLSLPPLSITIKQLFTFFIFSIGKPLYNFGIGKWLLALGKQLRLLTRIIEPAEKKGKNLPFYPARLSNALAEILLLQFSSLSQFNTIRLLWGKAYSQALQNTSYLPALESAEDIYFLRFPLVVKNPHRLQALTKDRGIMLGDWYSTPIAPKDADATIMQYKKGSCPRAEKLATHSINLPTHFTLTQSDFKRIVAVVQTYASEKN